MLRFIRNNSALIAVSVFAAIFITMYNEMRSFYITGTRIGLSYGELSFSIILKVILIAICALIVLLLIARFKHLFKYLDKYRYIIGLAIIIIWTVFEFSGSSIALYHWHLNGTVDPESSGTLLGISRQIRTDEYTIWTLMNFSQEYNNYNGVSDILRGTPTDVTTFYGNPSWSLATLFRPFLWGYLVLGSAKGLAFYWISRTVCLLLISYEFGKIFISPDILNRDSSYDHKVLSFAYACLITFSQTVQWWYSTNGLMEMLIFGQLAVVLLYYLLHAEKIWVKLLCCLGIIISAGGYLFTYYPAQQVPLMYIWLVCGVAVLIKSRKMIKAQIILMIIGSVIILGALVAVVLMNSLDTINATMNTVYPGKRVNTGGDVSITHLFFYFIDIFTPFNEGDLLQEGSDLSNTPEAATIYSLFPLGILLSLYQMIRRRKKDGLSIALIAVEIFFLIYVFIGIPEIIAKISFLSYSLPQRTFAILGIIDLILLFRTLSYKRDTYKPLSKTTKIIITVLAIIAEILIMVWLRMSDYNVPISILLIGGAILIWCTYLVICYDRAHTEKLAITLICVITFTGLCVNPLQKGIDVVTKDDFVVKIKEIATSSDDKWIVATDKIQLNDLPIVVGAKTVNSVNAYPNTELWSKLDPTGSKSDIYNRYAQIKVDISNSPTTYTLVANDQIMVTLNPSDLKLLGISYVLSDKPLDEYGMELMYNKNNYYIYKNNN